MGGGPLDDHRGDGAAEHAQRRAHRRRRHRREGHLQPSAAGVRVCVCGRDGRFVSFGVAPGHLQLSAAGVRVCVAGMGGL